MTVTDVAMVQPEVKTHRVLPRRAILIVGVILIPTLLSIALNSYGALTVEGALRMAFATVAGQTVAVISAIAALILTIRRRYGWVSIIGFALLALLIVVFAISNMGNAGDLLLTRLDKIAEIRATYS